MIFDITTEEIINISSTTIALRIKKYSVTIFKLQFKQIRMLAHNVKTCIFDVKFIFKFILMQHVTLRIHMLH